MPGRVIFQSPPIAVLTATGPIEAVGKLPQDQPGLRLIDLAARVADSHWIQPKGRCVFWEKMQKWSACKRGPDEGCLQSSFLPYLPQRMFKRQGRLNINRFNEVT